ncbi:hypothetical protein [Massilia varians]|uniref:hypothetical protein n=1 Tax=Massilia varians TaxID=457921 RepID=UPI002491DFF8|nr:hypothetical protein [Massilia varians]
MRNPDLIGSTVIGAASLAPLKEIIDAADLVLSEDVVKRMDEIHARHMNAER